MLLAMKTFSLCHQEHAVIFGKFSVLFLSFFQYQKITSSYLNSFVKISKSNVTEFSMKEILLQQNVIKETFIR